MNYLFFLPPFLLVSFITFGQLEIDRIEKQLLDKKDSIGIPDYKWLINVSGDYYTNSNAITNSFINALAYQRTFIGDPLKDKNSARLKKNNRFGLDGYASIQGEYKGAKSSIVFGFGQRVFASAKFSEDLFEIVFRGNSAYAGKNANLDNTNFKYIDYQNYFLGIKKPLKEGKLIIGATAAYIRGGRYQSLQMDKASLYTEEFGQYISLNGDLNYTRNDKNSIKKNHGNGAGLNLQLAINNKKNRINFEIRDIGFIAWKDLKTYEGNANFTFNGIQINNILEANSAVLTSLTLDSIAASAGINNSKGNVMQLLPTVFHANYTMTPNKKFSRTIGVRYMLIPGYIPKIYIREVDFLGKGFSLANTISYGGFGRFDYEIGFMKKIKNSLIVSANLFAFEYLVLPNKSSGNGVNVALIKLF